MQAEFAFHRNEIPLQKDKYIIVKWILRRC